MLYALENIETGKLATLSFVALDEWEMAVSIGSSGDVIYTSLTYLGALKVLSMTANRYSSDACSPQWDYKDFGETYKVVTLQAEDEAVHSGERFECILPMLDKRKTTAAFMIDLSNKLVESVEIDHTLVDNVEFPDKISYEYCGFFVPYEDEKFNELVGKIMFLSDDQYGLYYIHAVVNKEISEKFRIASSAKHGNTILLVSRVNN